MPEFNSSKIEDRANENMSARPSEQDFQQRIEAFKLIPGHRLYDTINQIEEWINGNDDPAVRETNYPGWANEDFKKLLKMLDENGMID